MKANLLIAAAALAAFASCGPKTVPVNVSLVTQACAGSSSPSPLAGVGFLRFTITSNGNALPPEIVALGAQHATLPQIPLGTASIEVDGLTTADASGRLVSSGTTGTFAITAASQPLTLTVFLRAVGSFTPTAGASAPTQCTQLTSPRAYHEQLLLSDGKVLIYGGLQYPQSVDWTLALAIPPMVVPGTQYLSSAEIYDPQAGTFTAAPSWPDQTLSPSPRAFGEGFALAGGGAVIVGGENGGATGNVLLDPAWNGGLYDPGASPVWGIVRTQSPHAHGCAAADVTGHLLVVGGYTPPLGSPTSPETSVITASPIAEYFDPKQTGIINPLEADPLPSEATVQICTPAGCGQYPIAAGRADQACSGFAGASPATAGLVFEAGGATIDPTGQTATILGDFFFYDFGSSALTKQPDFIPYLTAPTSSAPVMVAGGLQRPRARAKAVALVVQEPGASSGSDAVLVTGGMTCFAGAQGGLPGCAPDFADGGTSGQLADPPYDYLQLPDGGPSVAQETELIHFPGNQVTVSEGPAMASPRIDHCAVALPDGRAVLLGGLGGTGPSDFGTVATAELLYDDPTSGTAIPGSQPIVPGLGEARAGMACTLLPDGSILVTGGIQTTGPLNGTTQPVKTLSSAEIFQPVPLTASSQ